MNLTPEQLAIVTRAANTSDPLAIIARAGGAKTTTLVEVAKALADKRILALAFNKKIAVEMQERLPANAESRTLNALGNAAFKSFRGKHHQIEERKCYQILTSFVGKLDPEEQEEAYERFAETLQAIKAAKAQGYVPAGSSPHITGIIEEDDFFAELPEEPSELQKDLINASLRTSIKLAFDGHLDFADQIYLSTLCKSVSFPSFDVILIDEAQDLSPLDHLMLKKIVKRSRLIAVGDDCQAIYGFRGAAEDSMALLAQQFSLSPMHLTVCFRCAPEIVQNASWRAPDMVAWPSTPSGLVERHQAWSLDQLLDGDAVICRNNAPLFYLAIALLRAKRSPELLSGDIIPGLLKIMKKLGKPGQKRAESLQAIAEWTEAESARSRSPKSVADRAACIRMFLEETETLDEAGQMLAGIAAMKGRIKLMTGHRSKGLEFDRVWFLDQQLCAPKGQDLNIKYVIETRARRELHYIETEFLTNA